MSALVLASALVVLSPGVAPHRGPAWVVNVGLSADELRQRTDALQAQGYRPASISAYNAVEQNRFAVIYLKTTEPAWRMDWGRTPDAFLRRAGQLREKGYSPVCLSGCNQLGAERLADLWLRRAGPAREISRALDGDALLQEANQRKARSYRPVWISSYRVNSINVYAVLWEKSAVPWELRYGMTGQGLEDFVNDFATRGYRPITISGLNAGGIVRYCAVWEKREGPAWEVRYGQSQEGFLSYTRSMSARGYRPTSLSGYNTPDGDRFASIWER
jgi:hypothetical protein